MIVVNLAYDDDALVFEATGKISPEQTDSIVFSTRPEANAYIEGIIDGNSWKHVWADISEPNEV